jgi:protein Cut8
MSHRKRKVDDEAFEDNMSISPQDSPAFAPRNIARPSKKVRANEVTGRPLALPRLLETLDADSLRSVLQKICERHAEIGAEVVSSAPRPSVAATLEVLSQYQDKLREAFPFGGTGSDYAYNRVKQHLVDLIEALVDFTPHYLPPNESQTTTSLSFLDSATKVVHELPEWDSQSHRHHKDNAYDEISRAWASFIQAVGMKDLLSIMSRVEVVCRWLSTHLDPTWDGWEELRVRVRQETIGNRFEINYCQGLMVRTRQFVLVYGK